LHKAAESAQELANISERLLQTSRLDTGRLDLHIGPVRLHQAVEEVMRSYRELQQAQGASHDLAVDVPSDVYVAADLGRIKEVLDNLIGNAVKYSPHGGRITVRCVPATLGEPEAHYETAAAIPASGPDLHGAVEDRPTIVLTPQEHDGVSSQEDHGDDVTLPSPVLLAAASVRKYHVILVTDEGMGIAANERPWLFGRFSRTESARASQIRGTGLGLYICRQIVRAMEGDVWLRESIPGRGSTFAVALPAATVLAGERTLTVSRGVAHHGA
jgi:signal transduction histidine kinase